LATQIHRPESPPDLVGPPINKSDPSEASPVFEQQQQVIILPKEITKPFQIRKGFVDYMQLFFRINSP
jgi:hypothetical protein